MFNETDFKVQRYLDSIGVNFSSVYICHKENGDNFVVQFGGESFDFFRGIGNRINGDQPKWLKEGKTELKVNVRTADKIIKNWQYLPKGGLVSNQLIVSPTAASVLYCLLLDADAGQETFNSFCDNFGYSNDSISAQKMYFACQEMGTKLSKVLTYQQRNVLRELLEDY